MRVNQILLSALAFIAVPVFFVTLIVYSPLSAVAGTLGDSESATNPTFSAPMALNGSQSHRGAQINSRMPARMPVWPRARVTPTRRSLDINDELAALEAVRFGLSEVGDGSSYVWHRGNGRLSGIVKPISSYRSANGHVCRYLELWLTTGTVTKKTEGIACRDENRVWMLGG